MLLIASQCNNHSQICLVPFLAYLQFLASQHPLTAHPIIERCCMETELPFVLSIVLGHGDFQLHIP